MGEQPNYPQQETATKVIKGTAKLERPKASKKLIDFLFTDKIDSISNYLIYSILGPSVRRLIYEMGNGALRMALLNNQSPNQPPSPMNMWSNGYDNYSTARRDPYMYNQMTNYGYAQPQPSIMPQRISIQDVSFDTKDDAYLVLDRMNRTIQRYGKVRVADFYGYAGLTGHEDNWTLQGNGWYDLNQAHPIMRTDGRWMIDFPPIAPIR